MFNQNTNNQNIFNQNMNNQNINNVNNNTTNLNINTNNTNTNMIKNEPKIIMPKPMVNQSKTFVAPDKSKIETNRVSMFLFNENNDNNNDIKQNQNNININKNNETKAPSSLFEGIEQPKKEEKKEENQNIKPPNFLFDEENKQNQKIEKPPTIIQPQTQQNIPKAEIKPAKKKMNFFDFLDTDKKENNTNKNTVNNTTVQPTTNNNTNINNNINTNINNNTKNPEPKKVEIKNIKNIFEENPKDEVKRMTLFEPSIPKKTEGNTMASRFENMMADRQKKEEKEKKPNVPPKQKKLDFASKISGLQDVLAGRMSMGGNVFTMPTGGIKTIKTSEIIHDEVNKEKEEELKTEEKEISKENMNVILEDNNKIQETSYEKQLEKKKRKYCCS